MTSLKLVAHKARVKAWLIAFGVALAICTALFTAAAMLVFGVAYHPIPTFIAVCILALILVTWLIRDAQR